jgi:hypothetical protein
MTEPETPTTVPPPHPRFQFSLQTLLLLFVVLGSSLAVFGAWGIVVCVLVVGLAVGIWQAESLSSPPFVMLAALWIICFLVVTLIPFAFVARESSRRSGCRNKLHQIGAALIAYYQANGCFPPAFIADKNGKPMHSWRLLILPYADYDGLYKAYDFTEPWDGPKNRNLVGIRLSDYACPSDPANAAPGATATSYLAVVGTNAAWAGQKPRKLADFGKDPSSTILVVEVTNSGIPWAEPRDLSLESLLATDARLPALAMANHPGGKHEEFFYIYDYGAGVHVAMADGSVRVLKTAGLSNADLWKILQIGACKEGEIGARVLVDDYERYPNWPNIAALAVWLFSVGTLLVLAVRSRKTRMTVGG